tara:strand:+ start:27212 stop:27709 length:498 start_codon:yes stop_codon:yes gene_type:complete
MFIPVWLIVIASIFTAFFIAWSILAANGRNPLPFPDRGSHIFAAASPEAKDILVALLATHGVRERFQMDSSGIQRSILWDGTIINFSPQDVLDKLEGATSCIGLVSDNPERAANAAAEFLKSRGFDAKVVTDAEPNLPIAFVLTSAFSGTAINFRKHVTKMPRPS